MSVIHSLVALAKEYRIGILLVPSRRYLAGLATDASPHFWEHHIEACGIEIVEASPEDWL